MKDDNWIGAEPQYRRLTTAQGQTTHYYAYDNAGRLSTESVSRWSDEQDGQWIQVYERVGGMQDNWQWVDVPEYAPVETDEAHSQQIDVRRYDAAGHEIESGPQGLDPAFVQALTGTDGDLSGSVTRTSIYDAGSGQLTHSETVSANGSGAVIDTDYSYDNAGNLRGYLLSGAQDGQYTFVTKALDVYRQTEVDLATGGNLRMIDLLLQAARNGHL